MRSRKFWTGLTALTIAATSFFGAYSGIPVVHAATRLVVDRDNGTPSDRTISVCSAESPVFRLKLSADLSDIEVRDLYLVNIDPATNRVSGEADSLIEALVLDYGNGKTTATLSNGLVHFSMGEGAFIVPRDGSITATVSVRFHETYDRDQLGARLHLATIPEAAAGGTIDPNNPGNFVSGTTQGIRAIFVVNGQEIVPGLVRGESDDFALVGNRLLFLEQDLASNTVIPASQLEIFRFGILNQGCDDSEIARLSFDIHLNNTQLSNITLYDQNRSSTPLNLTQPALASSGTVSLNLDRNAPQNGETIGQNDIKWFVLKADVKELNSTAKSISTRLAGEATNGFIRQPFGAFPGTTKIIWSDNGAVPHGLTSPASNDWMNGALFSELPGSTVGLSNDAFSNTTILDFQRVALENLILANTDSGKAVVWKGLLSSAGSKNVNLYQLSFRVQSSASPQLLDSLRLESENGEILSDGVRFNGAGVYTFPLLSPLSIINTQSIQLVASFKDREVTPVTYTFELEDKNSSRSTASDTTGNFPITGRSLSFDPNQTAPANNNANGNNNSNGNGNTNSSGQNSNANLNSNENSALKPVIQTVEGPDKLLLGETGSWTIVPASAGGGTNGYIYEVFWEDSYRTNLELNIEERREFFSGTSNQVSHSFANVGSYHLRFIIQDSSGNLSEEYEKIVQVYSPLSDVPPARDYATPVLDSYHYTNPFTDTTLGTLEGDGALELFRRGILQGYAGNMFDGSKKINRAEVAKILVGRTGLIFQYNISKFKDIVAGTWYAKYVMAAYGNGLVTGYPDGTFGPEKNINTAEFLKMLTITFDLEQNLSYSYTDVPGNIWFARYAGIAQKYNLLPERSLTQLDPSRLMTRKEVVVAIYQILRSRSNRS